MRMARPLSLQNAVALAERLPDRWRFERVERSRYTGDWFAWAYRETAPGSSVGVKGAGASIREALIDLVRVVERAAREDRALEGWTEAEKRLAWGDR